MEIKNLFAVGAHFHLSDSPDPNAVYNLHLSSDHKQILMGEDHDPINMRHILEVKTLTGDQSPMLERGECYCRPPKIMTGSSCEVCDSVMGNINFKLPLCVCVCVCVCV